MEEKETFGIPSSKIYRNGEVLDLGNIPYFFDSSSLFSQVGGRIVDAKTKQPLVGANIYTDLGVGVSVADKRVSL